MINKGLFTSATAEWATPISFFNELDAEFHFTLDPCATPENAKCKHFYTIEDDGLTKNWGGARVFCNPPYAREIPKWAKKCWEESQKPNTIVVLLVPARTDTGWFWDYVYGKAEIRFIRGRLHFNESKQGAPFPSMLAIYGRLD